VALPKRGPDGRFLPKGKKSKSKSKSRSRSKSNPTVTLVNPTKGRGKLPPRDYRGRFRSKRRRNPSLTHVALNTGLGVGGGVLGGGGAYLADAVLPGGPAVGAGVKLAVSILGGAGLSMLHDGLGAGFAGALAGDVARSGITLIRGGGRAPSKADKVGDLPELSGVLDGDLDEDELEVLGGDLDDLTDEDLDDLTDEDLEELLGSLTDEDLADLVADEEEGMGDLVADDVAGLLGAHGDDDEDFGYLDDLVADEWAA